MGSRKHRAIVLVLDGLGIGAMPDAAAWGDEGSATLQNTAKAVSGLHLPFLQLMGLGNITHIEGIEPVVSPLALYGKAAISGQGKDTTSGHWELMGVPVPKRFPVFPHGFPAEFLDSLAKASGQKGFLGNEPASGTEIIARLGEEHIQTHYPIVYTSADSVFQIAAHENVLPVEQLYSLCTTARTLLNGDLAVARVIARPFTGEPGSFSRTPKRRDWSLEPPGSLLPVALRAQGFCTVGIGKVDDIMAVPAFDRCTHTTCDSHGMELVNSELSITDWDFLLANLNDLDTVYGHRNNPDGFAQALVSIDKWLDGFVTALDEGTMLIITADHGNDPTTPSTDHCREYVPILCYLKSRSKIESSIGLRNTLSDIAATTAQWLHFDFSCQGTSFVEKTIETN